MATSQAVPIPMSSVRGCARCGLDHLELVALPLDQPFEPPEARGARWTHWIACPTNGQPILVRFEETPFEIRLATPAAAAAMRAAHGDGDGALPPRAAVDSLADVCAAAKWAASFIRCEIADETEKYAARMLAILDRASHLDDAPAGDPPPSIPAIPNVVPGDRVGWMGAVWTVVSIHARPDRGQFAIEFAERDGELDQIDLVAAKEVTLKSVAARSAEYDLGPPIVTINNQPADVREISPIDGEKPLEED